MPRLPGIAHVLAVLALLLAVAPAAAARHAAGGRALATVTPGAATQRPSERASATGTTSGDARSGWTRPPVLVLLGVALIAALALAREFARTLLA